jgi:hypothetical protein
LLFQNEPVLNHAEPAANHRATGTKPMRNRYFLVPSDAGQQHVIIRAEARPDFDRWAWSKGKPVLCALCCGSLAPHPRADFQNGAEHAALCFVCFDRMFEVVA